MKKAERTKQFIIEAAAPIFNKNGYEGTSISDIIESTGLTKGAIYGHFENKDELALAALEYNLNNASTIIFSNVKDRTLACDKLKTFAEAYSLYYGEIEKWGGCPVINAAVDSDDGNTLIRKRVTKFIDMWRKSIRKIINEGIEKGELSASVNPEVFPSIFISLIEGAIMLSKTMNDRRYIDEASAHIISLVDSMKRS